MNIKEAIEDYIMVDTPQPIPAVDYGVDEELFDEMINFILNLDPEQLTIEQVEKVIDIIERIEILANPGEENTFEAMIAKKTVASKKQYSRSWYRRNKSKIEARKEKFKKSAEYKKRKRAKKSKEKANQTATGRPKRRYNTKGHVN